jgi:hypothetical protein
MSNTFAKILSNFLFFASITFTLQAQCPLITLDKTNATFIVDDFTDALSNPVLTAATHINVNASLGCQWDLIARVNSFNSFPYTTSATQGSFDLSNIFIRAVNFCETPDHDYNGDLFPDCSTDLTRICSNFNNPLTVGLSNYILGTINVDGPALLKTPAPCLGTPINDIGNASTNPTTHRFRIDFEIDFSAFPANVLTPGTYQTNIDFVAIDDATGVEIDIETFTLEIIIQPVLQLNMKSPNNLEFNFTDIRSYQSGIVKYSATILEISSNMNWDLIAIGTSTRNESAAGLPFWDAQAEYGTSGSNDIPLDVLELHQIPANPLGGDDYSNAFVFPPVPMGSNNIEVARGGVAPAPEFPSFGNKTIAGNWDMMLGGGNYMEPGSYLFNQNNYRYSISYRITPGLPSIFPNGTPALPTFARPGSYTMQVRYLLTEDQ